MCVGLENGCRVIWVKLFVFFQVKDGLILLCTDMFNLACIIGLGNFGGVQLGMTISTK
jgi:hypothetical protein